jgi:hypothetical protein
VKTWNGVTQIQTNLIRFGLSLLKEVKSYNL